MHTNPVSPPHAVLSVASSDSSPASLIEACSACCMLEMWMSIILISFQGFGHTGTLPNRLLKRAALCGVLCRATMHFALSNGGKSGVVFFFLQTLR